MFKPFFRWQGQSAAIHIYTGLLNEDRNGNLMYKIEPTYKAMENFYQEQSR